MHYAKSETISIKKKWYYYLVQSEYSTNLGLFKLLMNEK